MHRGEFWLYKRSAQHSSKHSGKQDLPCRQIYGQAARSGHMQAIPVVLCRVGATADRSRSLLRRATPERAGGSAGNPCHCRSRRLSRPSRAVRKEGDCKASCPLWNLQITDPSSFGLTGGMPEQAGRTRSNLRARRRRTTDEVRMTSPLSYGFVLGPTLLLIAPCWPMSNPDVQRRAGLQACKGRRAQFPFLTPPQP